MKKFFACFFIFSLIFGSAGTVFADNHDGDKDCSDFGSTEEAEQYWAENGYDENNDPDGLDRDKDGIPCESSGEGSSENSSSTDDGSMEESEENGTEEASADDEQGGELPETATPYATYALSGMVLLIISGGLLLARREN